MPVGAAGRTALLPSRWTRYPVTGHDCAGVRLVAIASEIVVYAALAAALLVLPVGLLLSDPPEVVLGVPIATAALATVAGLVLLGRTARRTNAFPPPLHNLPLAMGVATPLLMTVVGGVLEAINERLLEVPLVVLAVGWIGLGAAISSQSSAGAAGQGTMYELS